MHNSNFHFEKETDESLQATALETAAREAALNKARDIANAKPPKDFDGETCIDCGEDIPQARLALGRWTCIYCQEILERNHRR